MYHKISHSVFPLFALVTLVITGLACGSSTQPTLIATSAPAIGEQPTALSNIDQPTQSIATQQPAQTVAPQNFKLGDVVSIGDSVLSVFGWEIVPGDEYTKPDAGKKFVAIEIIIVNKSNSAISISTFLQMYLKDDTGQKYDVDLMVSSLTKSGSIEGELSPGEKVRGKVGFQVAENATGLQFVFDASITGTGKVFVDLGTEPNKVEPPTSLAGETSQQMYKVGDVIQISTLTITVNSVTNPKGDEFNKPNAGYKFVVLDITIENKGSAAANISTFMQMSLKDSSSNKYDVDLTASMASGGSSPDGELAPNEKMRGQVGFQVPESATGLIFVFDGDTFGTGKIFVALP